MILRIYSIRDSKTVMFGNPMCMFSDGQAMRGFQDEINRVATDNPYYQHPEDYDLFYLGTFDTDIGVYSTGLPVSILSGSSAVIKSNS